MIFKKKKGLLAPIDGSVIPLSKVKDEAFAQGMLGVGYAVEPSAGTIYSPVDGDVESVADTGHAYTIHTSDGLDVLVHVGIDTVSLGGKGFLPMAKVGDKVKAGDVLGRVDLEEVKRQGFPVTVPVLVTNADALKHFSCVEQGEVRGGQDTVMEYRV